jgi:hypothetical protein
MIDLVRRDERSASGGDGSYDRARPHLFRDASREDVGT